MDDAIAFVRGANVLYRGVGRQGRQPGEVGTRDLSTRQASISEPNVSNGPARYMPTFPPSLPSMWRSSMFHPSLSLLPSLRTSAGTASGLGYAERSSTIRVDVRVITPFHWVMSTTIIQSLAVSSRGRRRVVNAQSVNDEVTGARHTTLVVT